MRGHSLLLLLCLVALPFVCGFGSPRLVDDSYQPKYRISTVQLQQLGESQQLAEISANAALVYDVDSDQILFSRNADLALPPASLTKLMTALLVLEKDDLQASVTILEEDLIGNTNMGLEAGEVLSVEQLLFGMLINSANDAAMALARHEAGSVDLFVAQMNQRSAELALPSSHFVNPHGLDAETHLSSARDLLLLTRTLWKFPLFQQIVSTKQITIAGHALLNTNELLGGALAINGVKTGTTDNAGECLITGWLSKGHQRFVVVLGSRDRYTDTRQSIYTAEQLFPWRELNPWQMSLLNRTAQEAGMRYLHPQSASVPMLLSPLNQNTLIGQRTFFPKAMESGAVGEIVWMLAGKQVGANQLFSFAN